MEYKTYNEWKAVGKHVRRGECSSHKNKNGVAVFGDNQVLHNGNHQQEDYDEEDYAITDYELCAGEWGD
jgi:hypothetical protein